MSTNPEIQRNEIEEYLLALHDSSKDLDADAWLDGFFTADASFQYANWPVISGADVRQMFKDVFAKLDLMTHQVDYFDYVSPRIYQAATIRYLVKGDDPEKDVIQIPSFATFLVKRDESGKLKSYRLEVFLDSSPVFQRIAEKGL